MEERDKNVTEENLEKIFSNIEKVENVLLEEAKIFLTMSKNMHTMDLFTSSVINRSISLIKGFLLLAKDNNYITAVPIIRMQIDNCLRFYASTLVDDYNDFFSKYLDGVHIGNIIDSSGKRMTDSYLTEKLDKFFPGISTLYKNTSGYVHLSNEHSFINTRLKSNEERTISFRIGYYDYFEMDKKVDFSYNMFKASEFLLELVKSWKYQKLKVEMSIIQKV